MGTAPSAALLPPWHLLLLRDFLLWPGNPHHLQKWLRVSSGDTGGLPGVQPHFCRGGCMEGGGTPQSLQVTNGLFISHPRSAARFSLLSHVSCPLPPCGLGALLWVLPIPSARKQPGNWPAERRSRAEVRSLLFLEVVGLLWGSLGLPRAGWGACGTERVQLVVTGASITFPSHTAPK